MQETTTLPLPSGRCVRFKREMGSMEILVSHSGALLIIPQGGQAMTTSVAIQPITT